MSKAKRNRSKSNAKREIERKKKERQYFEHLQDLLSSCYLIFSLDPPLHTFNVIFPPTHSL
jgi:hypothetical protein